MAQHTVFGSTAPSYTMTAYNDGTPNIMLGNYFYVYGGMASGWYCTGGRLYLPNSPHVNGREVSIKAWHLTTSGVDLSTTPLREATVTAGLNGGWIEASWEPFALAVGEMVFIGYSFLAPYATSYAHTPSPSNTFVRSVDNVDLALAEGSITTLTPNTQRGEFKLGSGATSSSTAWYGVDLIVTDTIKPNPIAAYGFNETSGVIANDETGNGHDLTLNSTSNFGMSREGNGLHQVGGGPANLITNTAPWLETDHRTIMFWGRRGSEGNNTWSHSVYQMDVTTSTTTVFGIFMNGGTDQAFFRVDAGGVRDIAAPEVPLGTWAHYALTYDRQNVTAYVDGVQVGQIAATDPITTSDGNLYIYGEDYQQQVIDDLRLFDAALTVEQINDYMSETIMAPDTEPPSVPSNVQISNTYQSVSLTWDASTDNVELQNYIVYRSAISGFTPGPGNQVGGPATNSYNETAPVGTFYYRVAARDETGNISAASSEVSVTTTADPNSDYYFPSGLPISVGSDYTDNLAGGITVGVLCAVSGPTEISGGRFYSPAAVASGVEVRLYENDSLVASRTGLSLSMGWNELLFTTPYIAIAGTDYVIAVHLPGPTVQYTALANAFPTGGTQYSVGSMYSTLVNNGRHANGSGAPVAFSSTWYGIDFISPQNQGGAIEPFGADIVEENALQGATASEWTIAGVGDTSNLGFAREFSVNVGETVNFSCHGGGTVIDIYRIGWYGGYGWRKVASITNSATQQPNPTVIPNSNGGVECTNWSTTASWSVPAEAISGLFIGVYRNAALDNASYIPFIVRDDAHTANMVYKTSDTTWALAYNYYGTPASPLTGKSLYGSGGPLGSSPTRTHAVSYHRPIVTREGVPQTYWMACEAPMIRFMERNGINVKYVASKDVDEDPTRLLPSNVFVSSGHDEYWSIGMRDNVEAYRDDGKNLIFFSGNEVFWRTRFTGDYNTMWCYKDTMGGPDTHVAGTPLDPVTWTGTWKDTRFPGRKPEHTLTGTDFRMNGVNDYPAVFSQAGSYSSHVFWRDTVLGDADFTVQSIVGFEADEIVPTQPSGSYAVLANHTFNIDGKRADDNGQEYAGNGNLNWGILSQRYASGAIVVGFGTCQWSWGLDAVHDRGINYVNANIQQSTLNLFADLGAEPATTMSALIAPAPVSNLDVYGAIPSGGARSGKVKVWDGSSWNPHPAKVWDGGAWVARKAKGHDGSNWIEGKD